MASVKIFDLYPAGSKLFKDSESFMTELVDNEIGSINGGIMTPLCSPFCHPIICSPLCKPSLTPLIPTPEPEI